MVGGIGTSSRDSREIGMLGTVVFILANVIETNFNTV